MAAKPNRVMQVPDRQRAYAVCPESLLALTTAGLRKRPDFRLVTVRSATAGCEPL